MGVQSNKVVRLLLKPLFAVGDTVQAKTDLFGATTAIVTRRFADIDTREVHYGVQTPKGVGVFQESLLKPPPTVTYSPWNDDDSEEDE
jgi:hypothetical protein